MYVIIWAEIKHRLQFWVCGGISFDFALFFATLLYSSVILLQRRLSAGLLSVAVKKSTGEAVC
jgi:hypothetical protein